MTTSKKAISAYVSLDLEKYLTKYCTEYDITRKDKSGKIKPALGTAIVEILRVFFSNDTVPSPLPKNVPLLPANVVTEDRLSEILDNLEMPSNVLSNSTSTVVTQDDLNKALSKIPSIVSEQFETKIANQLIELKKELDETIELKFSSIVSELEAGQDYDTPTIDDKEYLQPQIDKSSLDPIFNDDLDEDEDVDWNELKVGELRKVITIKGLGNKFREKLRKSPRESKKAEIVKFLSETSIFNLD